MKKSILCLICCVVLAVCMTSCDFFEVMEMPDDYVESYPTPKPPVVVEPREGGTLTIASTKYETLNPLKNTNFYMEEVLGLIYDGLVTLDSGMRVVPVLAESLTPSADAKEWTVALRQNIIWHDGKYFSSEDVIHTIGQIQSDAQSKYAHCVSNVVSMEEVDAYTVLIKLQNPDSFFGEKLFFPILPKHANVDVTPVGTGLYKFAEGSKDKLLLQVYGLNATIQQKKAPYISNIQVKFFQDTMDVLYSDCDIVMVKSDDYEKISGKIGYNTKKYVSTEYEVLAFNVKKGVLSDSSVRRAIAYAIDRNGAVGDFSKVEGAITDLPVVPAAWIRSDSRVVYHYDVEQAVTLLENAGYTAKQLTFSCLVNQENPLRVKYAAYFKKALEAVGITLNITAVPAEELMQKLSEKNYDMALVGMNISQIDDLDAYYGSAGSTNISGYANDSLDALFAKISGYIYENERKTIFAEIESILLTDAPYVGLYYKQNFIFYNKSRVYGVGDISPSYCKKFMNIESWFIVEDSTDGTNQD